MPTPEPKCYWRAISLIHGLFKTMVGMHWFLSSARINYCGNILLHTSIDSNIVHDLKIGFVMRDGVDYSSNFLSTPIPFLAEINYTENRINSFARRKLASFLSYFHAVFLNLYFSDPAERYCFYQYPKNQ